MNHEHINSSNDKPTSSSVFFSISLSPFFVSYIHSLNKQAVTQTFVVFLVNCVGYLYNTTIERTKNRRKYLFKNLMEGCRWLYRSVMRSRMLHKIISNYIKCCIYFVQNTLRT